MKGVFVSLRTRSSSLLFALALVVSPATTLAASPTLAAQSASPATVEVVLSNDGCAPSPASITAGPVTFNIRNVGGDRVTEVELLRGDTIVGEKENLAPGLSGSFSVTIADGDHQLYCPGAATEYTPVSVTAAGAASAPSAVEPTVRSAFDLATAGYQLYVRQGVAQLVTDTQAFAAAIEAGDIAQAKLLYPAARVDYERIEPVAESFGDLDPAIDMREDDANDQTPFIGFHRLEQALWRDGNLDGTAPVARQLVADTLKLQQLVNDPTTFQFEAAQIANGSTELLDEVAKSKITGEEERYSKLDLLDMAANVDGARKGFELLQPGLGQLDPRLSEAISARFATLDATLAVYADGNGWRAYDRLAPSDIRALSQAVDDLAESLSQVAAKVVIASGESFGTQPNP